MNPTQGENETKALIVTHTIPTPTHHAKAPVLRPSEVHPNKCSIQYGEIVSQVRGNALNSVIQSLFSVCYDVSVGAIIGHKLHAVSQTVEYVITYAKG